MNLKAFAFLLLIVAAILCTQQMALSWSTPSIPSVERASKRGVPNQKFIKKLTGLWIAAKYKTSLYRTNSIIRAEKLTPFYTDFYFGGDSLIWLGRPYFMESRQFVFNPSDSTARTKSGRLVLKIRSVGPSQLKLYTPRNGDLTFTRVRPDSTRLEPLWLRESDASYHVNRQWISGNYWLQYNGDTIPLSLSAKHGATPATTFCDYNVFGWRGYDFLMLTSASSPNDGSGWAGKEFIINRTTPKQIMLTEIQPIENEFQPIVKTGKTALLLRR